MRRMLLIGLYCCFASVEIFAAKQCEQMYGISHSIMQMRQWGTPITEQMEMFDEMEKKSKDEGNKKLLKLYRLIVVEAYKEPRFDTKEYQDKISTDFANNMTAICYRNTLK